MPTPRENEFDPLWICLTLKCCLWRRDTLAVYIARFLQNKEQIQNFLNIFLLKFTEIFLPWTVNKAVTYVTMQRGFKGHLKGKFENQYEASWCILSCVLIKIIACLLSNHQNLNSKSRQNAAKSWNFLLNAVLTLCCSSSMECQQRREQSKDFREF